MYVPVQPAEDMREAALQHLERATIVIKAAAVADYRVKQPSATKIKSRKDEGLTLDLAPNPDILKELAARLHRHLSKAQVEGVMGDNWIEFLGRSLPD